MFNCFFLSWLLFIFISLQVPVFNCNKFGHVPAMYVFGDSLVDSGNNNYLVKSPPQNFLPYGIDFGGTPTGRATNGKTIADFIALFLNLPLSPSYMGLSEIQRQNVTTGINYASASCGILPETASKGSCLSLDNQMELFQRTVEVDLPKHYKNQSKLEEHLSESLFFVSIGVNDFFFIYVLSLNKTRKHLPPDTFAYFLVNQLSMRLQRLYNLGARKFLVNNLPPAGCIPAEVVKLKNKSDCNEESNALVNFYNRMLPDSLQRLQKHLHGAIFSHSDYYNFLLNLRQTAKLHGITHRWKSCCPKYIHLGRVQCLPHSSFCKNRDKFLFFDAFHPSQTANFIYATHCLNDSTVCSPFNFQRLLYDIDDCIFEDIDALSLGQCVAFNLNNSLTNQPTSKSFQELPPLSKALIASSFNSIARAFSPESAPIDWCINFASSSELGTEFASWLVGVFEKNTQSRLHFLQVNEKC